MKKLWRGWLQDKKKYDNGLWNEDQTLNQGKWYEFDGNI